MPLEGMQLGRFRLVSLLGSGGMGEVYLAEDTRINREVAIKVIRPEVGAFSDTNAAKEADYLFQREMKAISRLDHPNILPLFEYGEENVKGTTVAYMVMPFRQEGSFATWLQERGTTTPLTPREVAYVINQAADALQHAHDHQIVHQDVKPANFLIRSRTNADLPNLLLADFGVAKFTSGTVNMSQNVRGTPTYMAPEQWNGHPGPATDQYALAIMAYELLTRRTPFTGNIGSIMYQHMMTQPQPPGALNPQLSPAINAVILRALSKQPENRFPSIAEFAQAFQTAVQGASATSPTVMSTGIPGASTALSTHTNNANTPINTFPAATNTLDAQHQELFQGVEPTMPSTPAKAVPMVSASGNNPRTRRISSVRIYLIGVIIVLLILAGVGIHSVITAHPGGPGSSSSAVLSVDQAALNGNQDCSVSGNPNLTCQVTLRISQNPSHQSLSWSTSSSIPGVTFDPSSGTLQAGQSTQVTITPSNPCKNGSFFFKGPVNTFTITFTCG